MAEVILRDVWKIFPGEVVAAREINLAVADREFMVLVGPSGCGKSTTLRMVAGLEEITRGTVSIGGRIVNDVLPKDRDIAMVFQNYALYPHMTVFDNMAFGLKLRKYPKQEIRERVEEAAAILGITDLLGRKPRALSGGQRQRVAVGRAIVRRPAVFLFDEPLSNLDAKLRVAMRAEISRLHHKIQATMIYVTHDQVEAMTMGDRITVMKDGLIQQVDAPLALYERPANRFVAGFIGSPAMNFLSGRLEPEAGGLAFVGPAARLPLAPVHAERLRPQAGRAIVLGIRPEDIYGPDHVPALAAGRTLQAEVDVVEPMGNELFLYLQAAEGQLVARVDPRQGARVGDRLPITLDMGKAHYFDPQSDAVLA
ncbi:sn-glycerol-3-phosphate ABC transporter ATP-binding protein UgpC [bacterium]|nr:sn-glycerol-3-phosphate ABC transporter ATP-binding protein UgpC [bacterium]